MVVLTLHLVVTEGKNSEASKELDVVDTRDEKTDDFSLDNFLQEIDEFECNNDLDTPDYKESFNQLCDANLEKAAFKDIGEFKEDGEKFWDFLHEKIYMPLAFEIPKQNSISEMLK